MKVLPRLNKAVLLNSALGVVLIAAVGGAYAVVDSCNGSSPTRTDTRTAAVSTGKVQATVSGAGLLTSPSDAGINFTTGGQLTKVEVKPGDKVTKGQELARVDDNAARQALAQAKTSLAAAKANLARCRRASPASPPAELRPQPDGGSQTHPRADPQPKPSPSAATRRDPLPPATLDAAGGRAARELSVCLAEFVNAVPVAGPSIDPNLLLQAQTQVSQAQSAVDTAQRTLDGTVLTSPVDGTVASVGATVGQTVIGTTYTSGAGAAPGTARPPPPARRAARDGWRPGRAERFHRPHQPDRDAGEGQRLGGRRTQAQAGSGGHGHPDRPVQSILNARVLSVSTLAVNGVGPGSAQYPVTLDILGPTKDLHTGQGVSVQIVAGEASDALFVPTAAFSGTGTRRTVTVVAADGTAHPAQVTVGVESDTNTQITSGLTQGQRVRITTVAP